MNFVGRSHSTGFESCFEDSHEKSDGIWDAICQKKRIFYRQSVIGEDNPEQISRNGAVHEITICKAVS